MKTKKNTEPKPEFLSCTEQEIMTAIHGTDPQHPIAQEVSRLVNTYANNIMKEWEKLGAVPLVIAHRAPKSPIEAIALKIARDCIGHYVAMHLTTKH